FSYPPEDTFYWIHDFIFAFLIMNFSLGSFWKPLDKLHLALIPIAIWFLILGFLKLAPEVSFIQNYVVVGLLLFMFSVLPSRADQVPKSWLKFYESRIS